MSDKSQPGTLGSRMKEYEQPSTSRKAFKGQPLVVRLDGKNFHTFCKGLKRPFDERLSRLMLNLTGALVDRFQPRVGYTQSDEITLVWHIEPHDTAEFPFDGRFQKLESLIAGYASAYFTSKLHGSALVGGTSGKGGIYESYNPLIPEKRGQIVTFDARAFVVPTIKEAYHAILWRQQDATKNAISMAAQSMFSHKSLQGLHGPEMQEKMWKEKGVNFNDYPAFFKRGTFLKRHKALKTLTEAELARIPEGHRPTEPVVRTIVTEFDCWLSREEDPINVLFGEGWPNMTQSAVRLEEAERAAAQLGQSLK